MNAADVLQACVDDVLAGRRTPAECAAQHPDYPELLGDLKAAMLLRAARTQTLSAAADQRIQASLRQRAKALEAASRQPRRPWASRWVVGPALAATLLVGGIGTAAAAGGSNPGDALYGIKRGTESAQVFFSPPSARAFVYTGLAQRRLDELAVVLRRSNPDAGTVTGLSNDLTGETAQALALVDQTSAERQPELLNTLLQLTDQQQAVLAAVEQTAPAAARAVLQRALQASGDGHAKAIDRLTQVLASQKAASAATRASVLATAAANRTQGVKPTRVGPAQTKVAPDQTKLSLERTRPAPERTKEPPAQIKSAEPDKTPRPTP